MGLNRRGFIMFAVGGAVGTLLTPIPWKLMDDISIWTQNWPWIPRLPEGALGSASTTSTLCAAHCGLDMTLVNGVPVTAEGDPANPLGGGICPICASSVRMAYRPARVKSPLVKNNGNFEPIGWDEATAMLVGKLKAAGDNVVAISGGVTSSLTDLLSAFVAKLGSDKAFVMPSEMAGAAAALSRGFGGDGQVGYDMAGADYVLMLGANPLNSWGTFVRFAKAYQEGKDKGAIYVYAGPVATGTAVAADKTVACRPGTQGTLALGIASVLLESGLMPPMVEGVESFAGFVKNYTPAMVEQQTGVSKKNLMTLAMELARANSPLVMIGSEFGKGASAFDLAAGMALNVLLGRVNEPGGMVISQWPQPAVDGAPGRRELLERDLLAYLEKLAAGQEKKPAVMLVSQANPVYALPHTDRMAGALDEKVEFLVSFNTFMDETAAAADLILPAPYFLEGYDDVLTPYGMDMQAYFLARKTMEQAFDTKSTPEVLAEIANSLDIDLGVESTEDLLRMRAESLGLDFDALMDGELVEIPSQTAGDGPWTLFGPLFAAGAPGRPDKDYPLYLAAVAKPNVGNDLIAITSTTVSTIMDDELKGNNFFVQINSATAANLSVGQGDKIEVSSSVGKITALVNITEAVMDNVVAATLGFGHTAWDKYAKDKGDNVYKLMATSFESAAGLTTFASNKVKIVKV